MSDAAQKAFDKYFAQFDPDESEWLDRSTQQIFIDGFNAATAQLAALKEEFAVFKAATAETAQTYIERINSLREKNERLRVDNARLDELSVLYREKLGAYKARVAELETAVSGQGKMKGLEDIICQWVLIGGDTFETECGEIFEFESGRPADFNFCAFCGKELCEVEEPANEG